MFGLAMILALVLVTVAPPIAMMARSQIKRRRK